MENMKLNELERISDYVEYSSFWTYFKELGYAQAAAYATYIQATSHMKKKTKSNSMRAIRLFCAMNKKKNIK